MRLTTRKTSRTSSPTRTAALPKARKTANNCFFSFDDPYGSYTGTCENEYEKPVQDVDDL